MTVENRTRRLLTGGVMVFVTCVFGTPLTFSDALAGESNMSVETYPAQTPDVTEIDPERAAFEAAQVKPAVSEKERPIHLSVKELLLGLAALVAWFGLFSGGILVGTQPYRETLQNATGSVATIFTSWLMVCAFWTITNIGMLACVAAALGALGRRTRFTARTDPLQAAIDATSGDNSGIATYYVSAIMRGFGVYVLVLAGLLVLATEFLTSPTQEAYMRMAPTISIISFYVGYDPSMFGGLLDRVKSTLQPTGNNAR